jgi:SulP family sulfate permease
VFWVHISLARCRFFPLLIYCVLGTSGQLALGPEVITATLFGSSMESITIGFPDRIALVDEYARLLSFMVGAIVLCLGLLRLGYLDSILSHTVVSSLIFGSLFSLIFFFQNPYLS